jgi:hypothetical protein
MSQNHQNLESVVERIVHEHFELEENLEKVIWIRSRTAPEICLLEVNSDTFATGMVQSFYFPPSEEIPYPLILAEVTPEEWQKILYNEIELPEGWSLENHKAFEREAVAA